MKRAVLLTLALILASSAGSRAAEPAKPAASEQDPTLLAELKKVPYKIVYESYQDGNWELMMVDADGSNAVNLTKTPKINELYPHASPDGRKLCFVCDEGEGNAKRRNVYAMNIDGTGRFRVADAARDPCWTPDGKGIVYLKDEVAEFQVKDFATKGLYVYDVATGKAERHPNDQLYHLYNVCCTADARWFVSTVHAGMGFSHGILAIEAHGTHVYKLPLGGCRPDVSPDGKKVAWGNDDYVIRVADLDFSGPAPRVTNQRDAVRSAQPIKIYHVDWSPDGKYLAFSRGPTRHVVGAACEMVGVQAPGWNICVADAAKPDRWVQITSDGKSDKEPDWVPVAK